MLSRIQMFVVFVILLFCTSHLHAESKFITKPNGSDTVIVFVHGIMGSSSDTWKSENAYWPQLIAQDSLFSKSSIFVYDYPTSLWATLSIDELAEHMRRNLVASGVAKFGKIIFLAHSMGGLVTRAFLLKNREVAAKTVFTYFYSTPTTGSQIAGVVKFAINNTQLNQMKPMDSDDFLADQVRQWIAAKFDIASYCAYEKKKTYGVELVSMQSAAFNCNRALDPLDFNHIDIVKPENESAQPYIAFRAAFQAEIDELKPSQEYVKSLERVLRKLNLTQMIKDEYLFPQMNDYVTTPTEQNWARVQDTAKNLLEEIQVSVNEAMKIDSTFFEVGNSIIAIAAGSQIEIDRKYFRPFKVTRKEWKGRGIELKEITQYKKIPTVSDVQALTKTMKKRFVRLELEMRRLLKLIRDET